MYPSSFDYHRPTTLAEAAALLSKDPEARPLAGGHSLLPAMKLRLASPSALVDLSQVAELRGIREGDGGLRIGAFTTHTEVADSALVKKSCALLAETAGMIGDQQVRNRGTIGGSVAHADPGADYPAALLALGATVVTGGAQSRKIPIADFYKGLLSTALVQGEILTELLVPNYGAGTGGAYLKHRHPASSFAVVGVAALVTVAGGVCSKVSLAAGGVSVNPVRLSDAEATLAGKAPDAAAFAAAAAKVGGGVVKPIADLYASGEFRVHLASVLVRRALEKASARAVGK